MYLCMFVCMYVCMYVCMSVCLSVRMLFPHSSKTNRDIFKIQTAYDQVRPGIGHSSLDLKIFGRENSKWPQKTGFPPIT